MTPEQQTALEALLGRTLTAEEVATVTPLVRQRDDTQLARRLSAGRTMVAEAYVSERGILDRWPTGPVAADAFLVKLETFAASAHPLASVVSRALRFLQMPEGLNIGSQATLAMLGALATAGAISKTEADNVAALGRVADPLTVAAVSAALNGVRAPAEE